MMLMNIDMPKLAIFDIDWTIIKPKNGRTFPKNRFDWQWLNNSVKSTVQNYERLGYIMKYNCILNLF